MPRPTDISNQFRRRVISTLRGIGEVGTTLHLECGHSAYLVIGSVKIDELYYCSECVQEFLEKEKVKRAQGGRKEKIL